MKVLFLYPNFKGMAMLPPGVALLAACLKRDGHEVKLFDTTIYNSVEEGKSESKDADELKSASLNVRPVEKSEKIQLKYTNVFDDFRKEVVAYKPDLIALSTTEDMFRLGIKLLEKVDDQNILTIAGGVFPTFKPEFVLRKECIDIVCKGEGEVALVELCRRLEAGHSYQNISNLWMLDHAGNVIINPTRMVDMDDNPLIDMSLFDESRFYRPMAGSIYKMFPVETHRGCPYKCAYCNSPSQMALYKEEEGKSYLRHKSFENIRRELVFYKEKMGAEYLYFWADTFFSWTKNELEQFAEIYQDIGLPFWCQTRPETITERRVSVLQKIGLNRMSLGVEHGNEAFRAKYLDRQTPNKLITDRLNLLYSLGVDFSVNNIIGFPYETRELAFDTIRFNKTFKATDRNAYPFTPFSGTPLRKLAEELGFIGSNEIVESFSVKGSLLDMPQFGKNEVSGLCKVFNLYVNFPESRWDEIRIAEEDTPQGLAMFSKLKDEFVETYWRGDISFETAAEQLDPHAALSS